MAEAHQAVAFNLAITHEGVHINYDEEVLKLVFQSGLRSYKKRFARFVNNFKTHVYPSSIEFLLCIIALVIGSRVLLDMDTSFGLIDILNHNIVTPYISPRMSLKVVGSELLSCLLFGIFVWLAKAMAMRYTLKMLFVYKGWMYEYRGPTGMSWKTKLWYLWVKTLTTKKPLLYSYQASLPRLPLPSLEETLTRYLRSVKPLESPEDYSRLVKEAEEFKNGIGNKLQRYLWLKSWWSSNYVSDWWEEYVYLRGRPALMINSNYYGIDALMINTSKNQASRAANLIYASLMFRRKIDRQELKPILVQGLVPLCSAQYERVFNTTRIPGLESDKLVHLNDSQHIVVYHKGKYFKLNVYHQSKLLMPKELEIQLESIVNDKSDCLIGEEHLAALTAAERPIWAAARAKFFGAGLNRTSLTIIETAAFVLSLDDVDFEFDPDDDSKLSKYGQLLLHGSGYDRWFDKSFTLVVAKNGRSGFNAEHSWADAPIMAHYWEFILSYEYETLGYDQHGKCTLGNGTAPPTPTRLKWDLPQELLNTIESCLVSARALCDDIDLQLVRFSEYGKGHIKKCKVSPDAYIQLAFQMAYYSQKKNFCLTYEASMTRMFREGRTETVRPVTCESTAFVRAMDDPSKSNAERRALMKLASSVHQKGYQDAMCGKGIDRHLFCLYVISRYLEVDSPFLKEVLSEPWKLSTSQTPHGQAGLLDFHKHPDHISAGGGFGPVADDGYGVSYIVAGEDTIFFHISSKRSSNETNSGRFAESLKTALRQMKAIFND